mmetsp:Transcript_47285/g.135520  ORF Transcript_47285/g.135520 Transcript_47285/m.135520 type:complete len:630 (-) Transcript_47285:278-2167(-)
MGRVRECLVSFRLRRRDAHQQASKKSTSVVEPARQRRERGSILPGQDPLCTVIRGSGRIEKAVDVARDFELRPSDVLGTGCSGAVLLAERRSTRQRVAVKTFSKNKLKEHQLKRLEDEVNVYLQVDHPNICRLLNVYEKGDKVWIVMELCKCELYDRLKEQGIFSERRAKDCAWQMLQAVGYLHSHLVVHRDLKLENWMYSSSGGKDRLKLIDFGFARRLAHHDEQMNLSCGTMLYVSPELLRQKYTAMTDMWSIGVTCYMLMMGRAPFKGSKDWRTAQDIQDGDFPRDGRWDELSADARDFIRSLLCKDPSLRLDAEAALKHRWFRIRECSDLAVLPSLGDPMMEASNNLWRFGHGSQLQRAALRVLAIGLTSRESQDFENVFLQLDTKGRGTISPRQLSAVIKKCNPEASLGEVVQILHCLDVSSAGEVSYSAFVTAMLAALVHRHEDKVRAVFDAFDAQGTGYLTAETLQSVFVGLEGHALKASPSASSTDTSCALVAEGLSKAEAEAWIAEVDYKGNGLIDYEEFTSALQGKRLGTAALRDDDRPLVRVFAAIESDLPRAWSEPTIGSASTREPSEASVVSMNDGSMLLETTAMPSFTMRVETPLKVRCVPYELDESYFATQQVS